MSKELIAATQRELETWPDTRMTQDVQGKHRKIVLHYKEHSRLVVLSNTPSDQRALPNHISVVRRELRGMGATKLHPQPSAKPQLPTVTVGQPTPVKVELIMKSTNNIDAIFSLIGSLRYGEMLTLAEIMRDAATETKLRRSFAGDWAKMLHSIADTKSEAA